MKRLLSIPFKLFYMISTNLQMFPQLLPKTIVILKYIYDNCCFIKKSKVCQLS